MSKVTRWVGMDVHGKTIVAAVCGGRGEAEVVATIPNRPEAVRKLLKKLGRPEQLRVCYESGPTGYGLYWQLTSMGVQCEVIAPGLIPVKATERVKTDRRDAKKLAQLYRSGELTAVWVPDEEHEALRDLVRARGAAKEDEKRAKHRLGKYLLRYGQRPEKDYRSWTTNWWTWLRGVKLPRSNQQLTLEEYIVEVEHQGRRVARLDAQISEAITAAPAELRELVEALQTLRGVAELTAVTLATEFGCLSRFESASQAMSYTGLVPSEHSSGGRRRVGSITRCGNSHLRRILVEAGHQYKHRARRLKRHKKLEGRVSAEVEAMAWTAQQRLHRRYHRLKALNKPTGKVVTAVARELVGFVWAIGREVEQARARGDARAA